MAPVHHSAGAHAAPRAPRALPQKIGFLAGETNGSYVQRLAWANGLEPAVLLQRLGSGPAEPVQPGEAELRLNPAALEQLSALAGCTVARLQRALHGLRDDLLPAEAAATAAWTWQKPPRAGPCLLQGCPGCAAAKGARHPVFIRSDLPWQVCRRHGRWLGTAPEAEAARAVLRGRMPLLLQAEQQRIRFERQLGSRGRILFADALSACAYWWNNPRLSLPVWMERQLLFPTLDYSAPFPAIVVIYPEVVQLARMLAQQDRLGPGTWERQMHRLFRSWGSPFEIDEVRLPLELWLHRHRSHTPTTARAPQWHPPARLARALSECVPQRFPAAVARAQATWGARSCLPFRYGRGLGTLPRARRTDILHLRPRYDTVDGVCWDMLPQPRPGCETPDPRRLLST
ncbi:TniQ family protein [Streptomyces sp. KS_5]|uniref:TniQ family protein n=1 Tax=Streptomyces sp. KS_5 TaxID=1881018 RepID=UPI00089490F6|nr:TniQ family protein [Streptomyces sp. KS_5]SEE34692.1 TniQ protein [Streptomyces sp. KS_5]